jgi:L,D-peptidoglycan transpeptidase YkuD (ErfK/YbiS/YcfS/YnhG family)
MPCRISKALISFMRHPHPSPLPPAGEGEKQALRTWTHPARIAMIVALVIVGAHARSIGAAATLPWSNARQLVLVTTPDWNSKHATLQTFTRKPHGWQSASAAISVVIGRAGAAWGIGLHPAQPGPVKHEGDGRSPAGVFAIGTAFGYAGSAATQWPYAAMNADDYCIDVDGSPLYNRIVDAEKVGAAAVAGSTEPMRRDLHSGGDQAYKLGFVIEHNPHGVGGAGSCIFAHLWKSPDSATAGCTAMAEPAMQALLAWLRPEDHPVFVLLPIAEYKRLHVDWGLPDPWKS